MNDQNGETLKLSHLIEGLYMFKVSVSAPGAYGETYANVTVLPREYHHISSPIPPFSNIASILFLQIVGRKVSILFFHPTILPSLFLLFLTSSSTWSDYLVLGHAMGLFLLNFISNDPLGPC
jgi:hypothetical protein